MTERDDYQDVMEQLSTLAPRATDTPRAPHLALARLKQDVAARSSSTDSILRRILTMNKSRVALSGLAALVVLIVAFSLPPVRAAASDFLGLFRVQKFAPISVSPQQLALLEQIREEGLYPGEFQSIEEPSDPQAVSSLDQAASLAGSPVLSIPALGEPSQIEVSGSGRGQLIVDIMRARRILSLAEVDPQLLPDSLDGAEVEVTIFPAVYQRWNDGVSLMQSQSPLVDYPDDVDPTIMGEALLQVLGMSPREASRLAANIDWSSTLLLPVPENVATFSEVTVNGLSALALTSVDGNQSSLIWQKDGTVFLLAGEKTAAELQRIAEGVQ